MEDLKIFLERMITLEPGAWEALMQRITPFDLPKKQLFLKQGEICKHIGYLRKGYLRLYYTNKDGEEITKDFNFENMFCGSQASFSTQMPSRFNIAAMEDCSFYLLDRPGLYSLFDAYKCFERMGRLTMEYMFDRKELRESAFLQDDAEKRYHDLLRQHPDIINRVPLKYISSYLGITPETLSRIRAKR